MAEFFDEWDFPALKEALDKVEEQVKGMLEELFDAMLEEGEWRYDPPSALRRGAKFRWSDIYEIKNPVWVDGFPIDVEFSPDALVAAIVRELPDHEDGYGVLDPVVMQSLQEWRDAIDRAEQAIRAYVPRRI